MKVWLEEVLQIANHQRNANQNYNEVSVRNQSAWPSFKSLQIANAIEGAEEREAFCTVGGNVTWQSHCEKWHGDAPKNQKQNCHAMQQSHSWVHPQTKLSFKKIQGPLMFIGVLVTVAKTWTQCLMNRYTWVDKEDVVHIYDRIE